MQRHLSKFLFLSFNIYLVSPFLFPPFDLQPMSSFVSSILQHSANKLDDMPIIGSRSKRKSLPTGSSSNNAGVTHNPRIATGTAGPACYNSHNDYLGGNVVPPPPPYDHGGPTPTPSTSWTSEMSALADKIRDEQVLITSSKQVFNLDRKSISQGLKLVSIAADEYDEGNEAVALDIYLTGLDKILMALPSELSKPLPFPSSDSLPNQIHEKN